MRFESESQVAAEPVGSICVDAQRLLAEAFQLLQPVLLV